MATNNFDLVWKELEAGVARVFQRNRDQTTERPAAATAAGDWLRMYTTVLNYCTAKPQSAGPRSVPVIRGKDIYESLKKYLVDYLEAKNLSKQAPITTADDAKKYLCSFMAEWKVYYASIQTLDRVFDYIVTNNNNNNNKIKQNKTRHNKQTNLFTYMLLLLLLFRTATG